MTTEKSMEKEIEKEEIKKTSLFVVFKDTDFVGFFKKSQLKAFFRSHNFNNYSIREWESVVVEKVYRENTNKYYNVYRLWPKAIRLYYSEKEENR